VPYYVGGLRFFATLPLDRLAQSLLRYLTASPSQEGCVLGEVLTRSGWGFAPFRISALRDRLGTKPQLPTDWLNGARNAGWPEGDVKRLETVLDAVARERREWQIPRPGPDWAGRFMNLLKDLDIVAVLGRDLIRRARRENSAELAWEGQGTRSYLDRIGAFAQALEAGEKTASLGWGRMSPGDFVRLYTGDVSFGSYCRPTETSTQSVFSTSKTSFSRMWSSCGLSISGRVPVIRLFVHTVANPWEKARAPS